MATLNKLGPDAGMFRRHPGLRREAVPACFELPADLMVDQTSLIKLMEDLVMDTGLAEAFGPYPVTSRAILQVLDHASAVDLGGVWMTSSTVVAAFHADVLPEASNSVMANTMRMSVKARTPSQWWLCASEIVRKEVITNDLPALESEDGNSLWVPTFDTVPKENFWETSIGLCLAYLRKKKKRIPV